MCEGQVLAQEPVVGEGVSVVSGGRVWRECVEGVGVVTELGE